jgi:hypothetical protein
MEWLPTLKTIAPTVASALLGPLGGLAVSAIGGIMGISDATQEKIGKAIAAGQLTPQAVQELKTLEMMYLDNERERGFKYTELEFKDVDSARRREVDTGDSTNRRLAFLIITAFILTVGATLMGYTKAESVMAGTLIGYLSAKAEQVLAYYFGSTRNSARKTELIAAAPAVKE